MKFLRTAVRNYATVGAVTEISRYVVEKVIREMRPDARYIVEYGAGNGTLTRGILGILPEDGRLVAVELLRDFAEELSLIRDGRLTVVWGDACEVVKDIGAFHLPRVDVAVSNIPFSLMNGEKRRELIRRTKDILAPGGVFLVYQNVPIVARELKQFFPKISWSFELRNLPPYFVMAAKK